MKKFSFYLMLASFSLFLSACTGKSSLPRNPKDGEERVDEQGNRWVYNAVGGYWLLYSMMNGASNSAYRYYPGTGSWTTSSGVTTTPPSSVSSSFYRPSSVKPNSSSSNSVRSTTTSGSRKVFGGSVHSSRSFGA